ncbi:uncharacterized protein TRIVIDRAFT_155264 [Trichoderma virens Gv29-8]|uniref:Uncharacterized protein n=1 Tax=Hypocrea virens (strain Gv29-8 / FGSC 10586) TaxID=413071 RepID=G9MZS5_HYPVG|nr:uncharacterized protein TRIVIDRAFT_155264 [Trichoderma virens Gv29-8]EHK20131.1 hypothetical protein TRIVIDRAFT_155264 [Trichoderma virens Gv29-8]
MGNDSDRCLSTLTGHSDGVMTVDWSPDGSQVVSGSGDKTAKIWDLASNKCITTFEGHTGTVMSAAWSHDGTQVATGSADNTVKIWDPKTGVFSASFTGHNDTVMSVAWSTGDRWMLSSGGNTVLIWDPAIASLPAGDNYYDHNVVWSPDGKQVASPTTLETVTVLDIATQETVMTLQGHSDWVRWLAWDYKGGKLATASHDHTVKIWRMT